MLREAVLTVDAFMIQYPKERKANADLWDLLYLVKSGISDGAMLTMQQTDFLEQILSRYANTLPRSLSSMKRMKHALRIASWVNSAQASNRP